MSFIFVYKPKGISSFKVCSRVGKHFNIPRVGHTGTLDPFAEGLLLLALGKTTRCIKFLEKERKCYRTQIHLGQTSATLDPESEILICKGKKIPTREDLEKVLKDQFSGEIEQMPPDFSALKINGKRAYALAREGKKVDLKKRKTTIFNIRIINFTFPLVTLDLEVSAGFYVRSFARDLGKKLYGGGMCQKLERWGIGNFVLDGGQIKVEGQTFNFLDLEKIESIDQYIISPELLISQFDILEIPKSRLDDFRAGRALFLPEIGDKDNQNFFWIFCEGKNCGMGEVNDGNLQPRIVF